MEIEVRNVGWVTDNGFLEVKITVDNTVVSFDVDDMSEAADLADTLFTAAESLDGFGGFDVADQLCEYFFPDIKDSLKVLQSNLYNSELRHDVQDILDQLKG